MSSKYIKKYPIPQGFQELLSEFTKEILRNQPKDIIDFSIEYFKCLQYGLVLDYAQKGVNIPCDFRPGIPALPKSLQHLRSKVIDIDSLSIKKTEQVKEEEKQKNDKPSLKKEGSEKKIPNIEIDEGAINTKKDSKKKVNILATDENISESKNIAPVLTQTTEIKSDYLNCIDFEDKENILQNLKNNENISKDVQDYINKDFEPNKDINNLIILIQKIIMSYYLNKGTEKEDEYNKLNEETQTKIKDIMSKCALFQLDFDTMENKLSITEFKKYGYYPRILKAYIYKLKHINDEVNDLMDEICFFIFTHHLKLILSEDNAEKIFETKPYLEKYFNHNIQLLAPEIYSFVLGTKFYDESTSINYFTSFSLRKRELCFQYYKFYNLKNYGAKEKKFVDILEKYLFISSPQQILEKIKSATEETKSGIEELVKEKIEQNYKNINDFTSRIVNIPEELVKNSYDTFMKFNTIEREIIINYLKLNDDYKDISSQLSEIKIDPVESNFVHKIKKIYFDIKYIPELNYRNYCIYNNKFFEIPESAKNYLAYFDNLEQPLDEEKLCKEFEEKNNLVQNGIFLYLLIKDKENKKLEHLLGKIKKINEKSESKEKLFLAETMKENFTLDSDEFIGFIKEYKEWKESLSSDILEYFKKENDEQKKEYFLSLNDNPEKIIIYNLLKIENINTENGDFEKVLEEYKEYIKEDKK